MAHVKSRIAALVAIVIGLVSFGFAPAYAVDERVIDVVAVTWAGAAAPAGDVNALSKVVDTEVNADWLKFTSMVGATTDKSISFKTGQILKDPISLVSRMACTGFAASEFMSSIRTESYRRLGISDNKNNEQRENVYLVEQIMIGGISFKNIGCLVADLSKFDSLTCSDLKIDGIIGANLMRACFWNIDFNRSELRFYNQIGRASCRERVSSPV